MRLSKRCLDINQLCKNPQWTQIGSFSPFQNLRHLFLIRIPFSLGIIDVSLQNSLKKLNKENEEKN